MAKPMNSSTNAHHCERLAPPAVGVGELIGVLAQLLQGQDVERVLRRRRRSRFAAIARLAAAASSQLRLDDAGCDQLLIG